MPKEEILTGPAVIKIVSTYMGPEHVELVLKKHTKVKSDNQVNLTSSIRFKWQAFWLNYIWIPIL